MSWVALLLILGAGLSVGWLAAVQFLTVDSQSAHKTLPTSGVEWLFAALAVGLALIGGLALLLAQIGAFSSWLLFVLWLITVVVLAARKKSRRATRALFSLFPRRPGRWALEYLVLIVWLVAAVWLFFRPHEYILGAADAGVYVNEAANISQTGRIIFDDPFLSTLDPELEPLFLREQPPDSGAKQYLFPGFNIADEQPGKIIPDFFPMHPVWQAVAYDLGGVWAALRMPGLWALLGSLAVYVALRQVVGWPIALLGLAGMSLNALQVWFARYPVAETLTGFLLWTSLWALGAWLDRRAPTKWWALVAALMLGQMFVVRIDTVFLLAIPILVAVWLFLARPNFSRGELAWYFLPLTALVGYAGIHALFISTPYTSRVFGHGMRTLSSVGLAAPALIVLLLGISLTIIGFRFRQLFPSRWSRWWSRFRRPILFIASALVLLLIAYGWFVRPVVGAAGSFEDWYSGALQPIYDHENLVRLGWYLSPVGVWLGAAGIVLLVWRGNRRTIAILLVGLFFSTLYLWRIQVNQHQIYAMRRYVPVVMPFFIFASVFALGWLLKHKRRWLQIAGVCLALIWLGGLAWSARGFVSQVDHDGLIQEMALLDASLPERSILIFNDQSPISVGDILGTPLRYIYGHDVLTLREPDRMNVEKLLEIFQTWQADGRAVYWVGDSAFLDMNGVGYESRTVDIPNVFLEGLYERKPTRLVEAVWTLQLHVLQGDGGP